MNTGELKTKKTQDIPEEVDPVVEKLREALQLKEEELEEERIKSYLLMSEVVRLRRVCEIYGEERDYNQMRAEKAERGMRNLRRWLKISGVAG